MKVKLVLICRTYFEDSLSALWAVMGRQVGTFWLVQTHLQAPISQFVLLIFSDMVFVWKSLVGQGWNVCAVEGLHLLDVVSFSILDHLVDVKVSVEHVESDIFPALKRLKSEMK